MFLPRSHVWTARQKWLIVSIVALALVAFGAFIYTYERYYRGPTESVFFGTWQLEDGCIDGTHLVTLEANHNAIGFGDYTGREGELDYRGRWYAGCELLVIHYDTPEESQSIIMRILDITQDVIRVRWGGSEMQLTRSTRKPPQASNQSLQPTAGRCEVHI
jgi:hypothetical protein